MTPPHHPLRRVCVRSAARADDVSRIVAAGALLAALRHEAPLEVSLSAEAGDQPPSESEWTRCFSACDAKKMSVRCFLPALKQALEREANRRERTRQPRSWRRPAAAQLVSLLAPRS